MSRPVYLDMSGTRTKSNPERFEPWFLEMHKDEACKFMSEALKLKRGNFCVRLASNPKYYAISIVNEKNEFHHYSISYIDDFYFLEVDTNPVPMRSLKEVVEYFKKHVSGSKPIDKTNSNYTTHLISISSNEYVTQHATKEPNDYINEPNKSFEKSHEYVNVKKCKKPLPNRNCHSDSITPTTPSSQPSYHKHHSVANSTFDETYCLHEENKDDYQNIYEVYDNPYELPNK